MTDHRLPRRTLLAAGLLGATGLPARAQTTSRPRTTYGDTGQPAPPDDYPDSAGARGGYVQSPPQTQPRSPLPPGPPAEPYLDDRGSTDRYGSDRGDPRRGEGTEGPPTPDFHPNYPAATRAETYSRNEIVQGASDFLGVTAEAVGSAVERVFRDNGRPTAYIAGEEGSGAFVAGLRYGKGLLYMKRRRPVTVYWQGPSVGWDFGGNGSRSFTLCYNLQYPDAIYRRFPGVEGTAYFIGGVGVNYQRADDITLAPMRAGVGLRLGANVGYLAYTRSRHILPF